MTDNTVLDLVRDISRHTNVSQSELAANWKRNGMLNKHHLSTRVMGMTPEEYKQARIVLGRLANTVKK